MSAISIAVILLLLVGGYWQGVFLATLVSAVVTQFSDPSSAKMYKRVS